MISRVSILAATSAVAARQYIKSRSTETTCASLATKDGRFKGKTVVITGGGGAFGKEGAAYFCAQGANVVLIDSSQSSLDSAAERVAKDLMLENNAKSPEDAMEIEQSEFTEIDNLSVCTCDVQDEMMVKQVFDYIEAKHGRIDCLWNNAGYQGLLKPIIDYPTDDFRMVQEINLVGAFNVLKHCAKKMAGQESGGAIVQSGSIAATDGTPAMCAYVASKAGLHALGLTAAKDVAPFNIRVNTILPGYIGPSDGHLWTRQIDLRTKSGSPYYKTEYNEEADRSIQTVPLKRLGNVDEIIRAVAFLLSDETPYITGANLIITGGS